MPGREKNFENRVKQFLREQGCWYVKYWGGGQFTRAGVPDLLICCNGHFIGAEIKGPTGRPSEMQLYAIDQIRKAGGYADVLYPDEFHEFKKLITELKNA